MSSQDVALYLYEVGANERKLEYCRQILAANTAFTPDAVFNLNAAQLRSSLSRGEFVDLVKSLGISSTQQEIELTFTYFQIDGKGYVTSEEFCSLIVPQMDASLKSLISKRSSSEFKLDYSLRYALQKFFFQIVENQVRLELLCRFTFEKEREERQRVKYKKLTAEQLREFLSHHGKYPGEAEVALIMKEVGLNKAEGKRNRLITEFLLAFNDRRRENQEVPKVFQRELSAMADIRAKYQSTIDNQENVLKNSKLQNSAKPDALSQLSKVNPLSQLQPSQLRDVDQFTARTSAKDAGSSLLSVNRVEDRIKTLMGSINLGGRLGTSRKEEEAPEAKQKQTQKEDSKKEKDSEKSVPSNNKSVVSKRLEFKPDKESIIGDIYSLDNRSERRDLTDREKSRSNYDYELTGRNKTDRLSYQKNKRITEDNFESESNSNSQLLLQKEREREKSKPTERAKASEKGKYSEVESKRRIEYLRSLIDSSEDKREGYMRKYEV